VGIVLADGSTVGKSSFAVLLHVMANLCAPVRVDYSDMSRTVGILMTAACLVLAAPPARAGTFSPPIRLPGQPNLTEWHFAVNDSGEGVAVRGSITGEEVYPVSTAGTPGSPIEVAMPRPCCQLPASIAISRDGHVALGVTYFDGTSEEPYCTEHCGWGCCAQVATASWRLGQPPPSAAQTIRQNVPPSVPHQIVREPVLVVGPGALTVLWVRADTLAESEEGEVESDNDPKPNETQLEEAYARFGEPLHVKRLVSVPKGIYRLHLSLAADGTPVASWIEDGNKLASARGAPDGDLSGQMHVRFMPKLTLVQGFGFAPFDEDTLIYASNIPRHQQSWLMLMTSSAGQWLSPPRRLGTIQQAVKHHLRAQEDPEVEAKAARRGQSSLAVWVRTFPFGSCCGQEHLHVRRGTISGHLGPAQTLGLGDALQGAFIDEHGRSVIIYRQLTRHSHGTFSGETFAVTALPGHRFGRPVALFPHHHCEPTVTVRGLQEPIVAISPNGHAIIPLDCENADYLVGYTP